MMEQAGRILIAAGLSLAALGLAVWGLGKIGFRGLPGDIHYESENLKFHFPIVTCLVSSIILSALLWLIHWLSRSR